MKLCNLKSVLLSVLAFSATCIAVSTAYADSYVRDNRLGFRGYAGEFYSLPDFYAGFRADFSNTLFMRYDCTFTYMSYVGLRSTKKETGRYGVEKLQKLTTGQQDGPREDLILPNKEAALDFCDRLISAARMSTKPAASYQSVFASGWGLASAKKVIAVGYQIPFEYEGEYEGKLTPAKKYWLCRNPWGWEQDATVPDENDAGGVRASGLDNSHLMNADTDINGRYHVICTDPKMPETDFYWFMGPSNQWFDGAYFFTGNRTANLDDLDNTLGAAYCAGQLGKK